MKPPTAPEEFAPQIRKPCPKLWGELVGDEKRRFCSECSLHVHNAAELTRVEAEQLLRNSSSRVCMRIEYDPSGAPLFREPAPKPLPRLARWVLSAGAALLAACQGGQPGTAPGDPACGPQPVPPPSKMGKVCAPAVLGDVAVAPAPSVEKLGEAVAPPPSGPR